LRGKSTVRVQEEERRGVSFSKDSGQFSLSAAKKENTGQQKSRLSHEKAYFDFGKRLGLLARCWEKNLGESRKASLLSFLAQEGKGEALSLAKGDLLRRVAGKEKG